MAHNKSNRKGRVHLTESQLKNIVTESVKKALKARISESIEEEDLNSRYDYAGYFFEGLALVKRNDKWGFIDKTGREVIPCKYDGADAFSNGLAAVCLNGKWGFVDKTGREVIPCKFDYVGNFSEGLPTVILNDKWAVHASHGVNLKENIYPNHGTILVADKNHMIIAIYKYEDGKYICQRGINDYGNNSI